MRSSPSCKSGGLLATHRRRSPASRDPSRNGCDNAATAAIIPRLRRYGTVVSPGSSAPLHQLPPAQEAVMGSTSFWQAELSATGAPELSSGVLRGVHEADVAIVGAGVTGTAAALWLDRPGATVAEVAGAPAAAAAT